MGASKPSTPPLAFASTISIASQPQGAEASATGPSTCRDKRKRGFRVLRQGLQPVETRGNGALEFGPANPSSVDLESLMAASRSESREAKVEHVALEKRTEITTSQSRVQKGYTSTPKSPRSSKGYPGIYSPWLPLKPQWSPRPRRARREAWKHWLMLPAWGSR